jgi:SHS2 domain-containing protein
LKLPIKAETHSPVKKTDRKSPFKELNHTADLRIEIVGKDEHELFRNAVASLYVLLGLPVVGDPGGCLPAAKLRIEGQDREEALVQLLGELLYRATEERRQFMVDALSVGKQEEGSFSVALSGHWRSVTEDETKGKREIKAVTYHGLRIRETQRGLSARVVLDM